MPYRLTFMIVLLCVVAGAQEPPAEKLTCRLSVKSGQALHFVMVDDSTTRLSGEVLEQSSESREFTLVFGDAREDGSMPAEMRYGRIYGWVIDENGEKVEYDSLKSTSTGVEDIDIRMSLLDKKISTRFDKRGRIVHFKGMHEALFGDLPMPPNLDIDSGALDGFALLFGGMPDRALVKGESWKEPFDLDLMGMKMKGDTNLTLKGVKGDDIVVASQGTYAVDLSGMQDMEGAEPSKMSASGIRLVSKATGMTSSAKWEQKLDLPMAVEGVDEPLVISVRSTSSVATLPKPTRKPEKSEEAEEAK